MVDSEHEEAGVSTDEDLDDLVIDQNTKEVLSGTLNSLVAWATSATNPGKHHSKLHLLLIYVLNAHFFISSLCSHHRSDIPQDILVDIPVVHDT